MQASWVVLVALYKYFHPLSFYLALHFHFLVFVVTVEKNYSSLFYFLLLAPAAVFVVVHCFASHQNLSQQICHQPHFDDVISVSYGI